MNQSRVWTIGAVLLIVALVAGTWFLGIGPRLNDARDADAARQQAIALNEVHRQTLAALKADFERIDEITRELEEAHSVIPELPDVSTYIASLNDLAQQSGAIVQELSVAMPVAYQPPADASGEYLATATQLAGAGLYVIDITLAANGSEAALQNFISALQTGQRLILVHDAQLMNEEGQFAVTIRAQMFGFSSDTVEAPEAPPPAAPAP